MRCQESYRFVRKSLMLTAEAYIDRASVWSKALVKLSGLPVKADPYSAVAELVRRVTGAKVPASKIYALVRRPSSLKEIAGHIHDALAATYAAECARQQRKLEYEIAIAKAAGASPAVVSAAARLGGVSLEAQGAAR